MEKDNQATSIEQIKQIMQQEQIQQQQLQQQQQFQQQQIQQQPPQPIQEQVHHPVIEQKEQPDMIKLGFIGLIVFFVLSTSQIEEILYTFAGEEQKPMMPFIKIGIAIGITYFLKNYIE